MGYYIGQFYIDKRDIFLLVAIGLLWFVVHAGYPIPYFKSEYVIFLTVLFLIAKGLILSTYDSATFIIFLITLGLTLYVPFFQSLIFLVFAFLFLRILKAI